jgi:transcriptional regulator with GAF, ATPase, and Fis domain
MNFISLASGSESSRCCPEQLSARHYRTGESFLPCRRRSRQAIILSEGGQLNLQIPEALDVIASATLKEAEYQHILSALEKTHWRIKGVDGAARQLGMNPSTLYSAMRRLNIPTNHEKDDMPS